MEKEKQKFPEIRLRGVGKQLREELTNISDNLGVPIAHVVVPKLHEIVDSYPAHMKLPKKKD